MSFLSALLNSLPGAAAQGLIWGLMAIGVYITFRILDVADLTVDGSIATGGAAAVMLIRAGMNPWLALLCAFVCGMLAGFVTGMFHTKCGIPAILSGILTQLALYSINLRIMDSKANQAVGVDKYPLMVSQRYVRELSLKNPLPILLLFTFAVIALLYWFFGTERGCAIRATGANQNMARAQGINTNANVVFGLMLSNGLVALSGALLAQFQGAADVNMGRGAIVIGLAAVIIGEVILRQALYELRPQAAGRVDRRGDLLFRAPDRPAARPQHERPQAHHGADRRAVPGHPVLEGQDVPRQGKKGGNTPCLNSSMCARPLTPAPSTQRPR